MTVEISDAAAGLQQDWIASSKDMVLVPEIDAEFHRCCREIVHLGRVQRNTRGWIASFSDSQGFQMPTK